MNRLKQMRWLTVLVGVLSLAFGLASAGDHVNEICLIGGEIEYCAPPDA